MGYPFLALALALAPQGGQQQPTAPASNRCVSCHEGLAAPPPAAHGFAEWRASAHGVNVTCDRCHGGDTTATEAAAAHRGVFPATDYRSLAYPGRIPATCGTCHQQELGFFIGSRHAERLSQGQGPSCVTCHGSMAVHQLAVADLDAACSACHRAGGSAPAATIDTARALLVRMQRTDSTRQAAETVAGQLTDARSRSRQQGRLAAAREMLGRARQGWHAFDLAMVRTLLVQADSVLALPVRRE